MRFIIIAIVIVTAAMGLLASIAVNPGATPPPTTQAQGIAAPHNQQVNLDGALPGEALITWNAAPGATGYRVGWLNDNDYQAYRHLPGNRWLERFTYANISDPAYRAYNITRMTPGDEYWFIVGTRVGDQVHWPAIWIPKVSLADDEPCETDAGLRNDPLIHSQLWRFQTQGAAAVITLNNPRHHSR